MYTALSTLSTHLSTKTYCSAGKPEVSIHSAAEAIMILLQSFRDPVIPYDMLSRYVISRTRIIERIRLIKRVILVDVSENLIKVKDASFNFLSLSVVSQVAVTQSSANKSLVSFRNLTRTCLNT